MIGAAEALADIDHADAAAMLLTDKSPRVRLSAASTLNHMTNAAAVEPLAAALDVDYGADDGRSRNPQVHAHVVRALARWLPSDPRARVAVEKAGGSSIASVKFLALAELK